MKRKLHGSVITVKILRLHSGPHYGSGNQKGPFT